MLNMPEVSTGATEAVVSEWLVAENSSVRPGEALVSIETDKAVVEIEAEEAATLARVLAPAGATVDVGAPVALLLAPEEEIADLDALLAELGVTSAGAGAEPPVAPADPQHRDEPVVTLPAPAAESVPRPTEEPEGRPTAAPPEHPRSGQQRVFASPLARKMIKDAGIALDDVTGTGPGGRIVRRDVEQALATSPADGSRPAADRRAPQNPPEAGEQPDGTADLASTSLAQTPPEAQTEHPVHAPATPPVAGADADRSGTPAGAPGTSLPVQPPAAPGSAAGAVPHSRLRKAIAARLVQSKQQAPHFYLKASVHLDDLLALRARVNEVAPVRVSVNDFVLKAVALASAQVSDVNVTWGEEALNRFDSVDVGVAIASSRGLVTPVLRSVDTTPITRIAAQVRDLAARADAGKLVQRELEGGTIAVTNLGMHGVEEFSAIINPPHAAILAVGAGQRRPVVDEDGGLAVATVMNVVLSVDHRAVDGALAARWLRVFTDTLQRPLITLAT
nr:dihydrolipoamide acetyltransferase family protein [Kineococcus aurantiacus]